MLYEVMEHSLWYIILCDRNCTVSHLKYYGAIAERMLSVTSEKLWEGGKVAHTSTWVIPTRCHGYPPQGIPSYNVTPAFLYLYICMNIYIHSIYHEPYIDPKLMLTKSR